MDKAAIIRKLESAFSYLTVDIPQEVKIDDKIIKLKKEMEEIMKTAENGDLGKAIRGVVELETDLGKIVNDFKGKVRGSEIDLTVAEAQLGYYLGIRRAIAILSSISDESLKRFTEKDEKKRIAEDRKRWYDYLKHLDEG